jgi:hypothetical protein
MLSGLLPFKINYETVNLVDRWYDSLDWDQPHTRPLLTHENANIEQT